MRERLLSILCAAFCFLAAPSDASVYQTGVALNGDNLTAWTQPNLSGDGCGLVLGIDPNLVLRARAFTVGIAHIWYSVAPGTAIDPAFIGTTPPFANSLTGDVSGTIQLTLGGTYLLGFWLDSAGSGHIPGPGDRFGWARLTYTASGLSLVNSAIEDTGTGIYAGTLNVVPEPASVWLLLWPLLAVAITASRRRQVSL